MKRSIRLAALFGLAALVPSACTGSAGAPQQYGLAGPSVLPAQGNEAKIRHVVYIVQENRSFDDLFQGYPGADTVSHGVNSHGQRVKLQAISLKAAYEIDHSADAMFAACNGRGKLPGTKCRMNGFDRERQYFGPRNGQFAYVPHSESKPYFAMAHEWVLSDRTFASQLDESFVAHQYIIAAQARRSVDIPGLQWGCEGNAMDVVPTITHHRTYGASQRPCFNYRTLGDELDQAGLTWRFYTSKYTNPNSGYWSAYQAVKHVYDGPDWRYVITPQKRFFSDVAAGKLANFTWITPTCRDSDHPMCGGGNGPSWVAALVDAVGESKFWKTTAIFVQWDDWGGLYDHVPPPYKDFDGLGFRVPLLVISPYAKAGYVSHVQYETASVLRFAEDLWGLPSLGAADARATSPAADCFDFSQRPRKFVAIKAPKGRQYFMHEPPDDRIPDEQ